MSRKIGSYSFWYCCPECNKKHKGKEITRKIVTSCQCGHIFTKKEMQKAVEQVKKLNRARLNGADVPKKPTITK